ncbi:MAG TPA: nucleotidyl transferase AbiEii/AbiGii toxin family protein [Chloroflexota bacterium]
MRKYRTAPAFKMALDAHLTQQARQAGVPIQRVRKAVLFERLLVRMHIAAPDRWLLKGALALDYRFGARARATNDMDLARADDVASATADLMAAAAHDLGDYFTFTVQQTDRLAALEDAVAMRYHVRADLTGRIFEQATLDIGFVPREHWQIESIAIPNLLAFAEFDPITIPVLPLATHVAEKLHAYMRGYGDGTRRSTREKDLVDLVLIAGFCPFDAQVLRAALEETFAVRGKQPLPTAMPPPPSGWGPGYRKLASSVGIDPEVSHGYARTAAFLDPVLATESLESRWDQVVQRWVVDRVPKLSDTH